jgi:phage tail tube protein FII
MTIGLCANYLKHSINGVTVTEIDVFNKITVIGGVDQSANARRILGFTY